MPSKARINARDRMLPEIDRIIEAHHTLRKGRRGRDDQKSILRSAILMLCGTWELYCESVVLEAAIKIARHLEKPIKLPEEVKLQLKQAVHDVTMVKSDPMRLAGEGWRIEYLKIVRQKCSALNTPKSENLDKLFRQCLGLKDISLAWPVSPDEVNKFIRLRGEIAHRGSDSRAVSREDAKHFRSVISKAISATDDAIYDYLKDPAYIGRAPWQKTSK